MTCRAGDYSGGIFLGNNRRDRMTEQVAVARRRRKTVTRAVVVVVPIGPRNVGPFGIRQSHAATPAIFPDRVPGFFVDQQMQVERISRRTLQKMLRSQPRNLFVAEIRLGNRPALSMNQQIVSTAQGEVFDVGHALPAPRLLDRKSTRLNSSHLGISYDVFCLRKKKK